MAEHNDALVDCAVATRGFVNGSDAMGAVTAATGGGLLGAIVGGVIDNNENRQGAAANIENCMALKGWSVIGLTEEEGKALEAWDDDPPLLREQLAPLIEQLTRPGSCCAVLLQMSLRSAIFALSRQAILKKCH